MKLKTLGILQILPAMFQLLSCGTSPDCFDPQLYCAAIVTDTQGLNDHGLRQDAWKGLEQSQAEGLLDHIAFIESLDPRDYEKNIAFFALHGYDVILTIGPAMSDETRTAANLYPEMVFISLDQAHDQEYPNLRSITFPEDQMGFLAGTLAARLTKTRVVAGICETSDFDSMWRYCEGFRAGVRNLDKEIRVQIEYRDHGSRERLFTDEAWGMDLASYWIKRGADVIFAAGGVTGQGALEAASHAGVAAIGVERDQAAALEAAGSSVVTSIYGRAAPEVREAIRLSREFRSHPPVLGIFGYVPLDQGYPASLTAELDAILQGLRVGEIQTTIPFEKP